jgi:hypothetical protein
MPRVADEKIVEIQNSHLFHLCLSEYEGYGHALHESLGVGAVMITTDASPMNEYLEESRAFLVCEPRTCYRLKLADMNKVTPETVLDSVMAAVRLSDEQINDYRARARALYTMKNSQFLARFDELMKVEKVAALCLA